MRKRSAGAHGFVGSELVGVEGVVVQPTTLPDIRAFERVSTTEILAIDAATIFDVYSGEVLWQAPNDHVAAVAGPDHVLVSDGARVYVEKWR